MSLLLWFMSPINIYIQKQQEKNKLVQENSLYPLPIGIPIICLNVLFRYLAYTLFSKYSSIPISPSLLTALFS